MYLLPWQSGLSSCVESAEVRLHGQKRQKREPLPAVRRLVSPKDWPWSMELADLGYGRTGDAT